MSKSSVYDRDKYNLFDGHINRNIRAAMAVIDLAKPYIWVTRATHIPATDQVEFKFQINGCINITEVSVVINSTTSYQLANETDETYCNYLVPDHLEQSVFAIIVGSNDQVIIKAIVDQNMT